METDIYMYKLSRPWNKTFILPLVFFCHVVPSYSNGSYGYKCSYKRQCRTRDDHHFHSSEVHLQVPKSSNMEQPLKKFSDDTRRKALICPCVQLLRI